MIYILSFALGFLFFGSLICFSYCVEAIQRRLNLSQCQFEGKHVWEEEVPEVGYHYSPFAPPLKTCHRTTRLKCIRCGRKGEFKPHPVFIPKDDIMGQ